MVGAAGMTIENIVKWIRIVEETRLREESSFLLRLRPRALTSLTHSLSSLCR